MEGVCIETPRFILRSLTVDDATEKYLSWMVDTEANPYIVSARRSLTVGDLRTFIAERERRDDVAFLGIFLRANGSHIGNIKYEPICPVEGYAIMGLLVGDQDWRGKGVAGEVLDATVLWLGKAFGLQKIVLGVDRDNTAAIRAYEGFGFRATQEDDFGITSAQNMSMTLTLGGSR